MGFFFVISGYLITRNLLTESDTTGRVALLSFWGRRIRRLVPAMASMVAVTLVAALFILPVIMVDDVVRQGSAAALYVSNSAWRSSSTSSGRSWSASWSRPSVADPGRCGSAWVSSSA
jgi:peptidoglycan/LPS O-acetylase OafA/YrhL